MTQTDHRAEALRLLERATALADQGNYQEAEVALSISSEHMAHHQLDQVEEHFTEQLSAAQSALLALNDPPGPHGPGCHCNPEDN